MDNTILENQIRDLKNIKPRENWKFCAKNEILKEESFVLPKFNFAMSPVLMIVVILGLTLYLGNSKMIMDPVEEKGSDFYFAKAEQKVRDLEKLAMTDENLDIAIEETKISIRQAVNSIPRVPANQEEIDTITERTKAIVLSVKNTEELLGENIIEIEDRVLAAKVSRYIKNGIEVANNKLEVFLYEEMNRLEEMTLTEEQVIEFEIIKEEFKEFQSTEDYSLLNSIAEKIYMLQNK